MQVQPTQVRAAGRARAVAPGRSVQPARPLEATAAAPDARQQFENTVIQAVAYAQDARKALEAAGHAVNEGTGSREAFNVAEEAFDEAIAKLKGLQASGKHFDAPWFEPWGYRVDRFFRACGAAELLTYRPPTLGDGQPAPGTVFEVKLAEAKKAAKDGVNPEAALPDLLKEATTPAQIDQLLALGRKGYNIGSSSTYYVACNPTYFALCYQRLEALEPPATLGARLEFLRREAADHVNPEPQLVGLLKTATTTADVDQILAVGRKGYNIGSGSPYYVACSRALFAAAYDRLQAIEKPPSLDAKLALWKRAAADGVDPESALVKLLAEARSGAEIEQILAAGRKGYNIGTSSAYYVSCSQSFFAAAHTRQLQLELEKLAAGVIPADRVKFALQPLPTFATAEDYRNFAVKAASYALVDIQAVVAARQAYAAGTLPEHSLRDAEDGLELSLKLVAALREAPSAGFDAKGFWDQYQVEDTAKRALG